MSYHLREEAVMEVLPPSTADGGFYFHAERGLGVWSQECIRAKCYEWCWYLDGVVTHGENREAARDAVTGPELWEWLRRVHEYAGT